jgi:hypothetical protein
MYTKGMFGKKHSIETRMKMREARIKYIESNPNNTCFKKGQPNHWLGRKHTQEELDRMSLANKGKPCEWIKTKFIKNDPRIIGENNPNWKGGRYEHGQGYCLVLARHHPFADKSGHILEHRIVMEKILGRYLKKGEIVHHKNGNKKDNRPENLILTVFNKNWHSECCPNCGFHFLIL